MTCWTSRPACYSAIPRCPHTTRVVLEASAHPPVPKSRNRPSVPKSRKPTLWPLSRNGDFATCQLRGEPGGRLGRSARRTVWILQARARSGCRDRPFHCCCCYCYLSLPRRLFLLGEEVVLVVVLVAVAARGITLTCRWVLLVLRPIQPRCNQHLYHCHCCDKSSCNSHSCCS